MAGSVLAGVDERAQQQGPHVFGLHTVAVPIGSVLGGRGVDVDQVFGLREQELRPRDPGVRDGIRVVAVPIAVRVAVGFATIAVVVWWLRSCRTRGGCISTRTGLSVRRHNPPDYRLAVRLGNRHYKCAIGLLAGRETDLGHLPLDSLAAVAVIDLLLADLERLLGLQT